MDPNARDLIDKLLDYNPENRLGMKVNLADNCANYYEEIKMHPFFSDIDFEALANKTLKIPCFDILS